MDTKKVNEVMRMIKYVAKQSTKVVAAALPIGSIAANALDCYNIQGGDLELAAKTFISRYHGVGPSGKFELDRFMKGSGSLILSGVAGWVIKQVA